MQGDEQNAFPAMPLSDYIDQFFGGFEQVGTDGSTKKTDHCCCWPHDCGYLEKAIEQLYEQIGLTRYSIRLVFSSFVYPTKA